MTRFILALAFGLFLIGVVLFVGGCSTYGHEGGTGTGDNTGAPPDDGVGGIIRNGSDGCDPNATCCVIGSCHPNCADGWVCITGTCVDVLKVCGAK